jgi:hypothetical protein
MIHYRPPIGNNRKVKCLNGSAHARGTTNMDMVDCPKCSDKNHNKEYWKEKARAFELQKDFHYFNAFLRVIFDEVYSPNTAKPIHWMGFGIDALLYVTKNMSKKELKPFQLKAEQKVIELMETIKQEELEQQAEERRRDML